MEHLQKLYLSATRRHVAGDTQATASASPPAASSSTNPESPTTSLTELPRLPPAHSRVYLNSDGDNLSLKPRKISKISGLPRVFALASRSSVISADHASVSPHARARRPQKTALFDRFLALPPELQHHALSFLDFGDLARLRQTCHAFRNLLQPRLVRSLLAGNFHRSIRFTCRTCLRQQEHGARLVSTDQHDAHYPLSSRCVDCVWREKGFDVGRKYLMGSNIAVYVCRWCGRPVTTQPAWNQPEFHKRCFKKYTQVVFLYYLIGLAQWVLVFIASGMCWHYFQHKNLMVVGVVIAGFMCTLWNFCLNAVRGTIMRTYHYALVLEAAILASWVAPLLTLFHDQATRQPHRAMRSYETAMVVFIVMNMVFRAVNVVGNAILVAEYKLWRHKKPNMSFLRGTWIRLLEVFIFFVEPQCIEQEYPPKWWFQRRRRPLPQPDDEPPPIVGVTPGHQLPGVGPYQLDTDHNLLPVP